MIQALDTGFGFWDPLMLLIVFALALLISFVILKFGRKDYDKSTEQVKPYLSGNDEPSASDTHIRGGNLYYGFTHALKGIYDRMVPLHTGILNDYIGWFFLGLAVIFLVVILI